MGKAKKIIKAAIVVAAVATGVAFIPGVGALAGATFFSSATAAYFGSQLLLASVLGIASMALTKTPSFPSASELAGRTISQRNPLTSRKVIYGEVKVGGAITFLEATNDNKDLHQVITIAGHEINQVSSVYFGDEFALGGGLTDGVESDAFGNKAKITAHNGSIDQAHDENLVSRTTADANFRQRGCAYIYCRFTYDQDVYANGVPNVSAQVQGKKLYDPRTDTTVYSSNPALCIRDYLTNDQYGLGATDDEIDDDLFKVAADICDEDVALSATGTEKRYTMNGVIDTANSPNDILAQMLSSCGGSIYYANGQWKLRVGKYIMPTDTITLDDLRGPIKVDTRVSGQSQFNAVKGIFVSPENNWQPTDYPEVTSATFESEDGGQRKYIDYTLPFTTSSATAQRLAKQSLYRAREQITVTMPCKLTAFKYEIGDTVMVTNERFGWDQKVFEVVSWTLAPEIGESGGTLGVDLILKETSAAIYAWDESTDERQFTFNNTNLPNFGDNPAPGLIVSDELRTLNEEAISALLADVSGGGGFTQRYEVEARKAGDSIYVNMGQASGGRFELLNVQDGATYTVRARTINSLGVRSDWHSVSHQVVGKTAPPSDVTGLTGNLIGNQYLLTWDQVPDLDLSYYRVRFAAADGVTTYQNSISLVPKVARPATSVLVPARNGTYFVKAVDKLGLASESPATIVLDSNINDVESLNVVETISEHPDFPGTTDDVVEIDEDHRLVLDTDLSFDSAPGNFDDATGLFDGGSGNIDAEGFYYFADSIDLGAVYTSRITATIKQVRLDYVALFDSTSGLFDDRPGDFDGDVNAFDDTDAQIQFRATEDDPTGGPTWTAWQNFQVSDVRAWGIEFRCRMTTTDDQATPAVSHLSVAVDMPDRVESGNDITTTAAPYSVTFSTPFKATPAIGIGAQDLGQSEWYEITSKSRTGFTIEFKQTGGSSVARTFDYVAKGYGREVT